MYAERPPRWNMHESLRRIFADPRGTYFELGDRLLWRSALLPYSVCPLLVFELLDDYITQTTGGYVNPLVDAAATPVPGCVVAGSIQYDETGAVYDTNGTQIHDPAAGEFSAAAMPPAGIARAIMPLGKIYVEPKPDWLCRAFDAAAPERALTKFDTLFTTVDGYVVYCTRYSAGASLMRVFLPRGPRPSTWMYMGQRLIQGRIHSYFPDHSSQWVSGVVIINRSLGTRLVA